MESNVNSGNFPCAVFSGWGWRENGLGFRIRRFEDVIQADRVEDIRPALLELASRVCGETMAVGFLSYEAAAAFGLPAHPQESASLPLLWFGLTSVSNMFDIRNLEPFHENENGVPFPAFDSLRLAKVDYRNRIQTIKQQIALGNTYQVNYTVRMDFSSEEDDSALYQRLLKAQSVPYSAYLHCGDWSIHSLSPELLLQRRGPVLTSRPMKGTIRRGRNLLEDEQLAETLRTSEKERAENIMIVDMARNDLGRICRIGSVQVSDLLRVERYRTLFQMTSTVRGEIHPATPLHELLAAVFPAASVTGAPKVRTMELIRELEKEPRGVYCGSIGVLFPNGDFTFNVAIRTLERCGHRGRFGIGSGILWDSDSDAEWEELRVKAKFLRTRIETFSLLETILLNQEDQYVYLDDHLDRMQNSARYWDFPFQRKFALSRLLDFSRSISQRPLVVRMGLDSSGSFSISHRSVSRIPDSIRVMFSTEAIDSNDPLYFHKTTRRDLYEREREKALSRSCFDILFQNEQGHMTEGSITNLFCRFGSQWITPPISDGLLAGIWRKHFIVETKAVEKSLTFHDFMRADEVVIGNSVMGALPAQRIDTEDCTQKQ